MIRGAKWTMLLSGVVGLLGLGANIRWQLMWYAGNGGCMSLGDMAIVDRGTLLLLHGRVTSPRWPLWTIIQSVPVNRAALPFFWMPRFSIDASAAVITVWPAVPGLLAMAFVLWGRDRRPPAGHCVNCGYDLTGNVSGVCPECGGKIAVGG